MPAFLAGEFHARLPFRGFDAVGRTALSAPRLDPSLALRNLDGIARHRLFDETFGFRPHFFFRHFKPAVFRTLAATRSLQDAPLSRLSARCNLAAFSPTLLP